MSAIALVAAVACVGLGYLWLRSRTTALRLHRQITASAQELQRLQMSFAQFAPEQLVQRITASGVPTAAEKKEVTVLFADLVSFTQLGERLDPVDLVEILNGYFARMSRVIGDHRGHVSKFIGDGMLAMFGALEPNPWQANDAVQAALAMRAELAAYNTALEAAGRPQLRVGIGLHRGIVITGIVGSDQLKEFTAIGNTVNVAARIERLTRVVGVDILVSRAVCDSLDPRFVLRAFPPAPIRGITEPIETFAVERFEP